MSIRSYMFDFEYFPALFLVQLKIVLGVVITRISLVSANGVLFLMHQFVNVAAKFIIKGWGFAFD